MSDFISIRAENGDAFEAFLAKPDRPNGVGLIILPEVYNVNEWVREVAADFASHGFTVLVPDLFWRQEPGIHLGYDQPDRARAQGEAIDVDAVVQDVGRAAAYIRSELGTDAKVAAMGFCLGGRLAVLAGIREPIDAVIGYYAVKLDQHLDEIAHLRVPTLLHFGETDPWVPNQTVRSVGGVLADRPDFALHLYPGTGHGFARHGYPPFNEAATTLARQRTDELLNGLTSFYASDRRAPKA